MTHSIQKWRKNSSNNFSERTDDIQYRKNKGIENPQKDILRSVYSMLVEWGAVSTSGIFASRNNMDYHPNDIIAVNYMFLYLPNWNILKEDFLQFSLNGKKLSQEKIDKIMIDFYTVIEGNVDIKTILGIPWDNGEKRNTMIAQMFTEKTEEELRFLKSCCTISKMSNNEAKEYLLKTLSDLDKQEAEKKDQKTNIWWWIWGMKQMWQKNS